MEVTVGFKLEVAGLLVILGSMLGDEMDLGSSGSKGRCASVLDVIVRDIFAIICKC